MEKLTEPATRIVVERRDWEALAPTLEEWLGFYPSLKAVTPTVIHAALTCYLAGAADTAAYDFSEEEKPNRRLAVEDYNSFLQILLGRHPGSAYQSPGEGGLFVDSDGKRVVWFASHMRGREIQVRETSYGWQAQFIFGQYGSTNTASAAFEAAVSDGYGYVAAYGQDDSVIAQSDFLSGARAPRKGWDWLPSHLKEEAEELLKHLGNHVPEVTKAVANALLERALRDQDAALEKLEDAANGLPVRTRRKPSDPEEY